MSILISYRMLRNLPQCKNSVIHIVNLFCPWPMPDSILTANAWVFFEVCTGRTVPSMQCIQIHFSGCHDLKAVELSCRVVGCAVPVGLRTTRKTLTHFTYEFRYIYIESQVHTKDCEWRTWKSSVLAQSPTSLLLYKHRYDP